MAPNIKLVRPDGQELPLRVSPLLLRWTRAVYRDRLIRALDLRLPLPRTRPDGR